MDSTRASGGDGATWRLADAADRCNPVRRDVRYLEVVLEYRGLEATRFGGTFFPAAVPYTCGDEDRVFYWQSALDATTPGVDDWQYVCATPYGVRPATDDEPLAPELAADDGRTVVVEGTVGGDSTEAALSEHNPPTVSVESVAADGVTVAVDANRLEVGAGERDELALGERTVTVADGTRTDATPTLVVRYPGERTFYHPAVDATYDLFPSFGLDLEEAPRTLDVAPGPNVDEDDLAHALGVDLGSRPYPERVLWQAFVHTAFGDPVPPTLAQFDDGLLAVWDGD